MRMAMIGPMRVIGGATVHKVVPSTNCYLRNITIPDVEIMKLKTPPLDVSITINDRLVDYRSSLEGIPVAAGDDVTFTFSEPIEYFAISIYVPESTDLCAMDEFKQWIENRPNKRKVSP